MPGDSAPTEDRLRTEHVPAGAESMPDGGVATGRLVLIVDDDPQVRRTLASLLRDNGIEAITAADGQDGLDTFRDVAPDLVLCDVMMPNMDGLEFCRQLKGDPETRLTPIVLLTGLGDVEDRVSGIEAGADDFLSKPFEEVELLARVRSLIRVKVYTDELERAEAVLFTLARAIEARDEYTEGHCDRLSRYGSALAQRLELPDAEVNALRQAGIVHDIGKISVLDSILRKPGPLTLDERAIMQQHPVSGERICKPLKSFRLLLPIIRHHHEKLDGTGYPDELRGEEIPITARILEVVDVFDALTSERSYKAALSLDQALETLAEEVERGWWDERIFEEFRDMVSNGLGSIDYAPG